MRVLERLRADVLAQHPLGAGVKRALDRGAAAIEALLAALGLVGHLKEVAAAALELGALGDEPGARALAVDRSPVRRRSPASRPCASGSW
jgi:hypothetical protein